MSNDSDLDLIRQQKMAEMANKTETQLPNEVIDIKSVDHFNDLVNKYKDHLIITDFWAVWCGPCRSFAPVFKALQKEYQAKGVIFTKLNVDELQSISSQFNVTGIPTTLFIHNKKLIHRQVGMLPKANFAQVINTVLQKTSSK